MTESNDGKVDFGRNPFEFKTGDTIATLKLIGDLDPDLAKEFDKRIRPQFETFASDLVLDLTECGTIHPLWTRPLMHVATTVKRSAHRMKVATANPVHREFFHGQGLSASFPLVPDVASAIRELSTRKTVKLDVAFINPFLEGTVAVLKRIAGTVAKPGTLAVRDAAAPLDGEITGMIPLLTDSFTGVVLITFPEKTYLGIANRMLGESHEAITPEIRDGAAEITNQIYGYAKRILNEKDYRLPLALPKVLSGNTPAELPPCAGPRIAIPFDSDAGAFTVEIRI